MQNVSVLIGKRIKEYRKRAGFTQQKLAEILNCSASFISRLETGSSMTSVEGLLELAVALNTPISSFFVDFDASVDPDTLQNPRLRLLFYQLSLLDPAHVNYMLDNIELFLTFSHRLEKREET